jgi:hypothetical protein
MLAALFFWGFLSLPEGAGGGPISTMVGVLEDVPHDDSQKPHERRVRTLFLFDGRAWKAFPHFPEDERELANLAGKFPKRVRWSICQGKDLLGRIDGRAAARFDHYSEVGLQKPVRSAVPSVGTRDNRFSGMAGNPVLQPLPPPN